MHNVIEITIATGLIGIAFAVLLWTVIFGGVVAVVFGLFPWGIVAGAGATAVWLPGLLSGRLMGTTGRSTVSVSHSPRWWLGTVLGSSAFGAAGAGAFGLLNLGITGSI